MIKYLHLEFPNGEVFEVLAEIVANHRTSYYAEQEGFEQGSSDWNDEWGMSMRADELRDWLLNNMDWEDIKPHARKITESRQDYDKMWGEIEIDFK